MKLKAENYTSPLLNQGTFTDVFVEDTKVTHKRNDKYLALEFEMYYFKNEQRVSLAFSQLAFLGMEDDEVSTNKTTLISIPNPDYDAEVEDSQERLTVGLFAYLEENNGVYPEDYNIVDYGYPTYEKALQYFEGGTFESPEIVITEPLAIGFILNTLVINGEVVGSQFSIV
jgi:hypothetical protein